MRYYVVIPAYNEAAFIRQTLNSLVQQTLPPLRVIIVDDNSTDETSSIASAYCEKYPNFDLVNRNSENRHLPGSKVIKAFNEGLTLLDEAYDFIVKLDADLILPSDYFEKIATVFQNNPKAGMAGGFAYIEKNGEWVLENLTDTDHIRGAFKAYRKACFKQIGGLQPAMGWDTADELLCRYYGWDIVTLSELKVKHLKPTGAVYDKSARYKQGEAFYRLGYGLQITTIAALKLAWRKKKPQLAADYIRGFFKAQREQQPLLVTPEQASFIRKYRWEKIKNKLL